MSTSDTQRKRTPAEEEMDEHAVEASRKRPRPRIPVQHSEDEASDAMSGSFDLSHEQPEVIDVDDDGEPALNVPSFHDSAPTTQKPSRKLRPMKKSAFHLYVQQRVEEDEFLAEEDELGRANGGNVDKRERLKRYAADWKALPDDDEVKMRLKANIKALRQETRTLAEQAVAERPKRPANIFAIFQREERSNVKKDNPEMSFGELAKLMKQRWDAVPLQERIKYEMLADDEAAKYAEANRLWHIKYHNILPDIAALDAKLQAQKKAGNAAKQVQKEEVAAKAARKAERAALRAEKAARKARREGKPAPPPPPPHEAKAAPAKSRKANTAAPVQPSKSTRVDYGVLAALFGGDAQ